MAELFARRVIIHTPHVGDLNAERLMRVIREVRRQNFLEMFMRGGKCGGCFVKDFPSAGWIEPNIREGRNRADAPEAVVKKIVARAVVEAKPRQ